MGLDSGMVDELDAKTRAALAQLTEREKDCLRRRLYPQTAKEMALEIGVSPHAVEKRLKTACAKLNVSTSLEAGRLLEAYEKGAQLISQPPGFGCNGQRQDPFLNRPFWFGVCATILFSIALSLFLIVSKGSGLSLDFPQPDEIVLSAPATFKSLDKDKSGFLEGLEHPAILRAAGQPELKQGPDGISLEARTFTIDNTKRVQQRFYAEADRNGDLKVSPAEFDRWRTR